MVVLASFGGAVVDLPHGSICRHVSSSFDNGNSDYCGGSRALIFRAFSLIFVIEYEAVLLLLLPLMEFN